MEYLMLRTNYVCCCVLNARLVFKEILDESVNA